MQEAYYTVGVVTGTHGLRGEVKVVSRTDFPETRFRRGSRLYLRRPGSSPVSELTVRSGRPHKQWWLVAFEGLPSINDVEGFKGMELCVHESQLQRLPEGTYYIHQLVGLDVVTEDGRSVGRLIEVLRPGANDVYVVRGPLQKRDVLLPAIPDCILDVDLSANRMTVRLLPGLLDADEEPDGEPDGEAR
ncbi:ribosome maturation factor RimM [Alicyclobacillus sp.]|uniref:ribosome maturation factor RimM n=1 Tax=Alicyclobacillus sp. TaxID=61169 RepID=UPI0025C2D3F5|nr:ribosome maturation factor RimM [Alicyclobacillus sp.]MCL6516457.1 ribosome maturation factor RimM [Alicyclobacillus sp.]